MKLPILALKLFCRSYGFSYAVFLGVNSNRDDVTTVTTWGASKKDCADAAYSGNNLKNALGWPKELCREIPPRLTHEECLKTLRDGSIEKSMTSPTAILLHTEAGAEVLLTVEMLRAALALCHIKSKSTFGFSY
jgi:hypothetical protein